MLFCHIEVEVAEHPKLREEKGLQGLPSVAFLDADGVVLVTVPYDQRDVAGLRRHGERARRYVALRAASARGDREAGARFLLMQLEERQLTLAAATARRGELGTIADPELSAALTARLVDLEVEHALRQNRESGGERRALGPRFLAMHRDGPRPSPFVSRGFWFAIFEWAEVEGDPEAFAVALDGMRRSLRVTAAGAVWADRLVRDYAGKLSALRHR